jgi:hypothetical protein
MAEDKKSVDPTLVGFYEAMERTNVEKITDETIAGLSGSSSDSESFDVESENKDAEDRPWIPSHVVFRNSTVKHGKIEVMKGKYFHDILSHPVLEGKPNANHVRARISNSRTQQLHNMDIITQCSNSIKKGNNSRLHLTSETSI